MTKWIDLRDSHFNDNGMKFQLVKKCIYLTEIFIKSVYQYIYWLLHWCRRTLFCCKEVIVKVITLKTLLIEQRKCLSKLYLMYFAKMTLTFYGHYQVSNSWADRCCSCLYMWICVCSYWQIPYKVPIFWYQQKEQIMWYTIPGDFFLFELHQLILRNFFLTVNYILKKII